MKSLFLSFTVILTIASGFAADRTPRTSDRIVLKAGRLLDPATGKIAERQVILVEGDSITAVSSEKEFSLPEGSKIIDLSNAWVLPGLIDCHVHLASDRGGVDRVLSGVTLGVAAHAYEAAGNARKTLEAGFTTVRNLGDSDGVTLALRDSIAAGQMIGPRIFDAGNSISTTSGHMDATLGFRDELHEALARHDNICDGPDECRRVVRKQIGRGVDVIKFATTGGVNSRAGLGLGRQMFEDEARALVETAHLYGKKVAVHAHGVDGVILALKAGADSIEHATTLNEEAIELFLKTGAYYVPTLATVNGYLERLAKDPNAYEPAVREKVDWRIRITGESLRKAVPRGVKIAFGTDAGVSKHGRNAEEFKLMVKHGMTPAQAIKAATINAADLLGQSAKLGSITPGKWADIIAVESDPLTDVSSLEQVKFVMKAGVIYKNSLPTPGRPQ